MKNKNERTMNMPKDKNDLKSSSLIPHLSYLKRKTPRFTLIELLVVIAIIAILAAMLLPSLNRARQSALTSKCQSHQKQWILANLSYAQENKEFLPWRDGGYENTLLTGYLPYKIGTGGVPGISFKEGPIAWCPVSGWTSPYFSTQAKGKYIHFAKPDAALYHSTITYRSLRRLRKPGQKFAYAEVCQKSSGSIGATRHYYEHLGFPHNNKQNVSFYDGHVQTLPNKLPYFYPYGKNSGAAYNATAKPYWNYMAE